MRPPLSASIALAYGAGLATGLARFPTPAIALLILLPLVMTTRGWPRRLGTAGLILGLAAGSFARRTDQASCAAVLPSGQLALTLRTEEPIDSGGVRTRATLPVAGCRGALVVAWPRRLQAAAGTELEVVGRWRPRAARFGRPGGILLVSEVHQATARAHLGDRIRTGIHETARRLYGRRAPLVDALVLGRRTDLDREVLEEFAGAGLMHLLAISGFHLGLLAGWVFVLLRISGVRREAAGFAAALFAVIYTIFLGWPAPAARAATLAVLLALERSRQRMPRGGALLGTTALLVMICDPWAVLSVGGWLSISALWGAVTFSQWAGRRLGGGAVLRTVATSIGATFATAPITAAALGTVALAGIVLNLVAIPLAALVVPAVVASLAVGAAVPQLAAPLAAGAGVGLGLLQEIARWGSALPAGHLVMPAAPVAAIPWAAVLLALLWTLRRTTRVEALRRLGWTSAAVVWGWLIVVSLSDLRVRPDEGSELALHFLDVGQGDAAAIRTPGGHWILIDGGPLGRSSDAGRSVVVPYLRRHGVRRLDAMVLSHAHADHLGGFPSILDRMAVLEVIDPAIATAEPLYSGFLAQVEELNAPWMRARRGDGFMLDSVEFRVLHPDTTWDGWGQDLNENSLVLSVEYRNFRAVLAGDAGLPVEAVLAGRVGRADLLKVGHHGSRGATGARWLAELRPTSAIISVGDGNRYGHPAPEAMARLSAAKVEIFRTDQDGTIEVRTDGRAMTIHSRRGVVTHTVSEP